MADKPVDTQIIVTVGPLIDDGDFKSEELLIDHDADGLAVDIEVQKTDGTITNTTITLAASGDYKWAHTGHGEYEITLPATGGGSFNNTEEGVLKVKGIATGVLPFRSASYDVKPVPVYDSLNKGTDKLQVDMTQVEGADATDQLDEAGSEASIT